MLMTAFFDTLRQKVKELGGIHNAHLHLCRAGTLEITEELLRQKEKGTHSHLSISTKHGIIPLIHNSPEYEPKRLERRVRLLLDEMIAAGTTRADTLVDVTVDRVGRSAFDVFRKLKSDYRGMLDLQIGSYSPLGFTEIDRQGWHLIEETAKEADFIGGLPERDDKKLYPDHIGFHESCARVISLAYSLDKRVHIHVDQKNDPEEKATLQVISVLDRLQVETKGGEPMVWLVHVISPSAYNDAEFKEVIEKLVDKNIGILCCPSAAISMRQLRPLRTPTHNSIARVLEFLAAGIKVRLGSDNINDITSPAGTTDLMDEVFVLCNAIRFYELDILAKITAGRSLDAGDRNLITEHLAKDRAETQRSIDFVRS
jgi:cytosine/creatinine deaminase